MKHLFYIHSAITYFVALGVIKYRNLDKGACILMLGRGFQPDHASSEIRESILPFSHHPVNSFAVERQFWKGWKKIIAFDNYVSNLTGEEHFHIYTNQTGLDFIRLFISHEKCQGFSYLEEGLYSYFPAEKVNLELCPSGDATAFYKLLKRLNFNGRLSSDPVFFSDEYKEAFGISEAVFPGFRNKITLENPFYNSEANNCLNGHIIALDALYEYGVVTKAVYEHAIKKMFLYFEARNIDQVWIKFHPEQYNIAAHLAEIREVVAKYKRGINVKELPQTCLLELIAGNSLGNVEFYVFLSSVGLYAGMCGKKAYSFANFIAEKDNDYSKRIELLPDVFKRHVEFIIST